jgi:hypothetical protein
LSLKSANVPKSAPIPKPSTPAAASAVQLVPSKAEGPASPHLPAPVFRDDKHHIRIYQGDCLEILAALAENCIDLIFADPPYFLSNNGITCHAGRMVSVNKGDWDRSRGADAATFLFHSPS